MHEPQASAFLFNMEKPSLIPAEISEDAVKAADCFVDLCLQHAAFLGGKGNLQEAIDDISKSDNKLYQFTHDTVYSNIALYMQLQSQ